MKKQLFAATLLTAGFITPAAADIVRVETAYNSSLQIHRFYFIDENGAETFDDGLAGQSFGAALEQVIHDRANDDVTIASVVDANGNAVEAGEHLRHNGEYTITLSNDRTQTFTIAAPARSYANDGERVERAAHFSDRVTFSGTTTDYDLTVNVDTDNLGLSIADRSGITVVPNAAGTDFSIDASGVTVPDSLGEITTTLTSIPLTQETLPVGSWIRVGANDGTTVAYVYDGTTWQPEALADQTANLQITELTQLTQGTIELGDARYANTEYGGYINRELFRAHTNERLRGVLVGQTTDIRSDSITYSGSTDSVTHEFSVALSANDEAAISAVIDDSFRTGYADGYEDGYKDGYAFGFEEGARSVR